jgi:trans-2,3-dihydro-3-hydroxyanthranilate isomerase
MQRTPADLHVASVSCYYAAPRVRPRPWPDAGDLEWKGTELAFAWMTQQKPSFGATLTARDQMAGVLGVDINTIRSDVPMQEVSCGSPFVFVPLTTRAAVDQCVLDPRANDAMFKQAGVTRRGLFVGRPHDALHGCA